MGKGIAVVIGIIVASFAISFLVTAGLVAIICWGLPLIGIATIGTWTVAFSWKLVVIVAVVMTLLRSIFSVSVKTNK